MDEDFIMAEATVINTVTREAVLDLDPINLPRMAGKAGRARVHPDEPITMALVRACRGYQTATETAVTVVWSDTRDVVMAPCYVCHRDMPLAWMVPVTGLAGESLNLMCDRHVEV